MVRSPLSNAETDAIRQAATRDDVLAAMDRFYQDLHAEIAAHQPVCWNRGACCRFDEFGHNLFVTMLEAAYFLAQLLVDRGLRRPDGPAPSVSSSPPALPPGCPFQIAKRCTTRRGRPMGCRIFFCDPRMQHWQGPMTEAFLRRLRSLHEELGVAYVYAEWRAVLQALHMG